MYINVFTNINGNGFDPETGIISNDEESNGEAFCGPFAFVNSIQISHTAENIWQLATRLLNAERPDLDIEKPLKTILPIIYLNNSQSIFSNLVQFCLTAYKQENYVVFSVNACSKGLNCGRDLSTFIGHRITIAIKVVDIEKPKCSIEEQRININNAFHQFCPGGGMRVYDKTLFDSLVDMDVVCRYLIDGGEPQTTSFEDILNIFKHSIKKNPKTPTLRIQYNYPYLSDDSLYPQVFYLMVKTIIIKQAALKIFNRLQSGNPNEDKIKKELMMLEQKLSQS